MSESRPVYERRTNHYPTIRTNRIYLSQTQEGNLKIRIDYSLNLVRPRGTNTSPSNADVLSDFLRSRAGRESVHISFMVLDTRNSTLVSDLFNYSSQITTMMNYHEDPRFALFDENNGWHRVPVSDALLQSADRELYTTVTDMGGETHYETHNFIEFEYVCRFDGDAAAAPISADGVFSATTEGVNFSETPLSELQLVAFLEMPYERFANRDGVPEELSILPITELVYDRLLEPTAFYGLRPPSSRKIFFINDDRPDSFDFENNQPGEPGMSMRGRAYSGPAHLHVDGMWYAGPNRENRRHRLGVRRVPNTKVTVDAAPLPSYSESPTLGQGIPPDTTGSDLESFIRSSNSTSTFLFPDFIARKMVENSIAAMSRKTKSFIEPWSYQHTWITEHEGAEQMNNSYNCIFGLKYYELIKNNTSFGRLMDMHFHKNNEASRKLIGEIFKKSKILNLLVTRRRISNDPYNNNDQDSKTYTDFENNQINKVIIQASDHPESDSNPLEKGIIPSETAQASIEEVDLKLHGGNNREDTIVEQTRTEIIEDETFIYDVENLLTRSFMIKDYELFYNLDCGKYTYDLEIHFKDGFQEWLAREISRLKRRLSIAREYARDLASPVIRSGPNQEIVQGYYDFYVRKFFNVPQDLKNKFVVALQKLVRVVNNNIFAISGAVAFPGDVVDSESTAGKVIERMNPKRESTRIEDIEFFLERCENLLESMENLLQGAYVKQKFTTSPLDVRLSRDLSIRGSDVSIHRVTARTGIIHDASDTTKLVADYGLTEDLGSFLERARREALLARRFEELEQTDITELENTDFPSPGGTLIDQDNMREVEFNPSWLEPIQFVMEKTLRLKVDDFPFAPTGLEGFIKDPIINPVRREPDYQIGSGFNQIHLQVQAPFSTNSCAIKITKMDFKNSSPIQKSVKELKILSMSTKDSHLSGIADKDPAYDARFISSHVGKVDISFGGKQLGAIDQTAARFAINNLVIDSALLTDGTKKAMIDDLIESSDARDFERRMNDNYKELSETRENLGAIYDLFNRISAVETMFIKNSVYKKNPAHDFKFGPEKKKNITADINKDPFEKKRAQFVTFTKNGDEIRHTTKVIKKLQSFSKRSGLEQGPAMKTVKLFKLKPMRGEDNIASVNNAVLLTRF